jgi:hypothetical protein
MEIQISLTRVIRVFMLPLLDQQFDTQVRYLAMVVDDSSKVAVEASSPWELLHRQMITNLG